MGSLLELFLDGTALKELTSPIQHLSGLVLLNLRECKSLAILPHSICKLKSLQTLIPSGCSKLDNLPEVRGAYKAFATASFFGLRSLRKLNLSDCRILEGPIPNDFSSLCSLEYLDLSRNNFVNLPASLNQLSQLKGLRLGYCKRLQSLPELPSSIEEIDAHDCTVMENILCPSSVYRSKECGGLRFTFSNCFRLSENESSNFVAATLNQITCGLGINNSSPRINISEVI
ncbi:TMV resistance protein N [Vitis vinifera]|uniref:TMV resistance protein N n=1 Tax=Vitis vinifera TaxID=29760 RepID=A0A438ECA4_VITVI|nr:TMV resistance protein N [Vitis vinifera]